MPLVLPGLDGGRVVEVDVDGVLVPGPRGADVDDGGDVVDALRQPRFVLFLLLLRNLAPLQDDFGFPATWKVQRLGRMLHAKSGQWNLGRFVSTFVSTVWFCSPRK